MRHHGSAPGRFIMTAFAALVAAVSGSAQSTPTPRLLYVMPPGGQAGTSVEILLTGQDIDNAEGLHFNFPGVKIERIGTEKTPDVVDPKTKKPPPKMAVGALSQKFRVTLPANAPLGIQDVRIITKGGISNPRAFVVGDMKEFVEKEPNSDVPEANRVEMNCTVNGAISTPIDVDYFLFTGKKGQRVVASCLTTSIDSKLQAVLELYSPSGGPALATGKGYHGHDALLDAELPTDGDYYVRVNSFTYTLGGPDYYYRLTISTAPWIDAVIPSIVESGKPTDVTVYGRNLPGGKPDPQARVGGRVLERATLKVNAPGGPALYRLAHSGFIPPIGAFGN